MAPDSKYKTKIIAKPNGASTFTTYLVNDNYTDLYSREAGSNPAICTKKYIL